MESGGCRELGAGRKVASSVAQTALGAAAEERVGLSEDV